MRIMPIRYCSDVEAATRFYTAIGPEVGSRSRPGAWVELPAASGMLAVHRADRVAEGACELAFEADEPLEAVTARLRRPVRPAADRGRELRPVGAGPRPRRGLGGDQPVRPGALHLTTGGVAPARPRPAGVMLLAVGIVALEFGAAVSRFVATTLLPTVARDLQARDQLGLLVGPAATLALEHLLGWRWTLLAPVPVVVVGRLLIVRAARPDRDETRHDRPLWRTLLVPVGVAPLVLSSGHRLWWPVAAAGLLLALVGLVTIMPAGTMRLRRGTPPPSAPWSASRPGTSAPTASSPSC